jgi:Tannase-like family of unknown function (DUF6351)
VSEQGIPVRNRFAVFWAALVAVLALALATGSGAAQARTGLSVHIPSTRADLVFGGQTIVVVGLPKRINTRKLKISLDATDETKQFAMRANGQYAGLIREIPLGSHVITARDGSKSASIAIFNHANGGPVIAGPQIKPWVCKNAGHTDAQCDEPLGYSYEYKSAATGRLETYNPASPPAASEIASTTTENGHTVPFIIRIETGYLDRDQFQIAVLFQPGKPWYYWEPQPQFDHKLLITGGSGCGFEYESSSAPQTTEETAETALAAGFAVMSTALDNAGHNCNIATQAESLMMAKEHLINEYGTLRFTIGQGCSGGSLTMDQVANAYPGIYQGLLPACTFVDAWSNANQLVDDHLTLEYFTHPATWGTGITWTPAQESEVQGRPDPVGGAVFNEVFWEAAVDPESSCTPTKTCPGVQAGELYNPTSNPEGVRATLADYMINVFGRRPESVWGAVEKKLGRGFASRPVGNAGQQYGLRLLLEGKISAAQFVDLNQKIGGVDIDGKPTSLRISADEPGLSNAYRSGAVNEANNLTDVPIIDMEDPRPEGIHDDFRVFSMRARLEREEGRFPKNDVIWFELDNEAFEPERFQTMNQWLNAVDADKATGRTLQEKVVDDRPASARDRCSTKEVSEGLLEMVEVGGEKLCRSSLYEARFATGRMVAGESLAADNLECQLRPLERSAYPGIAFTEEQWKALEATFPTGVCDFSTPGVGQQATVRWQTYQNDSSGGAVIFGGQPLGPAPASSGEGWTSPAFAGWTK